MKKILHIAKIIFLVFSLIIIPLALFLGPALVSYSIDPKTTNIGYGYLFLLISLSITSYIILKDLIKKYSK